jgi:hypothetical protein
LYIEKSPASKKAREERSDEENKLGYKDGNSEIFCFTNELDK